MVVGVDCSTVFTSSCDDAEIPVLVTTPRFELMSQRQKVSRLPTEPPGRPAGDRLLIGDKKLQYY